MRGYLDQTQISLLENCVGKRLSDVFEHYWEKEGFSSFDYLELNFVDCRIVLSYGSLGEDIAIVSTAQISENVSSGARIRTAQVTDKLNWQSVVGRTLSSFELTDYKGYCNTSIILNFDSLRVEVYVGCDCVNLEFENEKIGKWL